MKRFLSILLVLGLLLSVPVCGVTAAAADAPAAGSYRLTAVVGGQDSPLEIISTVLDLGVNYYLFLREDGTGSMRFMEAELPLTWDEDTLRILPFGKNPQTLTLPLSCDEGGLSIRTRAYSMEFRALTEAEQREYDVNGAGSLAGMAAVLAMRLIGSMDGELVDNLFLSLALGAMGSGPEPIPEGEPTEGPMTGLVKEMEITVLGAEKIRDDDAGDVIVFWYDVTNRDDVLRAAWELDIDAAQGGEFLEQVFELESVPELFNVNYGLIPDRTIRCASAFQYDPDGGVTGFRVGDFGDEEDLFYYADPQVPGDRPEDFSFESDMTVPEAWAGLPGETENVHIADREVWTDDDGGRFLRCSYRCLDVDGEGFPNCSLLALQDGVELMRFWDDPDAVNDREEHIYTDTWRLRTGSPVYILVFEDAYGDDTPAAVKIVEVE